MTWFKVDDTFHGHPKLAELEQGKHFAEALALWTVAGSWCAHHLTDGRVPAAQLRKLVPFPAARAAAELVRVGLWLEAPGGYAFNDWLDYQPTRARVEAERAATAGRLARWREKNANKNAGATPTQSTNVTQSVTPLQTLAPTRPDPTRPSPDGDVERATPPPTPRHLESFQRSLEPSTEAHAEVVELVSATRQHAGGAPFRPVSWQDREAVQKLAEWASSPDIGLAGLRSALEAFWAAKGTKGTRLSWLTEEDPGRWLAGASRPHEASGAITVGNETLVRFEAARKRLEAAKDPDERRAARREYDDAQMAHALAQVRSGVA